MNHQLLTYEAASQALLPVKFSARSLKRAASKLTPISRRLRVVRLGPRTVGIRPADLEVWKARCLGEGVAA